MLVNKKVLWIKNWAIAGLNVYHRISVLSDRTFWWINLSIYHRIAPGMKKSEVCLMIIFWKGRKQNRRIWEIVHTWINNLNLINTKLEITRKRPNIWSNRLPVRSKWAQHLIRACRRNSKNIVRYNPVLDCQSMLFPVQRVYSFIIKGCWQRTSWLLMLWRTGSYSSHNAGTAADVSDIETINSSLRVDILNDAFWSKLANSRASAAASIKELNRFPGESRKCD